MCISDRNMEEFLNLEPCTQQGIIGDVHVLKGFQDPWCLAEKKQHL